MPSGQQIVNGALTALGLLEQGGTPSVSDSNDTLAELNIMWDAWGVDDGMVYSMSALRFAAIAAMAGYSIGPGGQWNCAKPPGRIYGARYVTVAGGGISEAAVANSGGGYAVGDTGVILGSNGVPATYTVTAIGPGEAATAVSINPGTGYLAASAYPTQTGGAQPGAGTGLEISALTVTTGGMIRVPLAVVEAAEYLAHRDLAASALTPDEFYPDFAPDPAGWTKGWLYPVPTGAGVVELDAGVPFLAWTLVDNYSLPQGMQDPIQYSLAWRLLPRFGAAVNQQTAEVVRELGQKAEQRMQAAIAAWRGKPAPAPQASSGQSPVSTPTVSNFQGMQPKG